MNALFKDLQREIKGSFGRFFAIFSIVLIGVAFFSGVLASPDNMSASAEKFFDDYNLQDIRLISTVGFNDEDIYAIYDMEGLEGVYPSYWIDAMCTLNNAQSESVVSLNSLPYDISDGNLDYINRLLLLEGRYPASPNECVIRRSNIGSNIPQIGDILHISSGDEKEITDSIIYTDLTIVGIAHTPAYISFNFGSSSIGGGTVNYVVYTPENNFRMEYFTSVYVTVKGAKSINAIENPDGYFECTDPYTQKLKDLAKERMNARADDIKALMYDEVAESVRKEATEEVTNEVRNAVMDEIEPQVKEEVEKTVLEEINRQVKEEVEKAVRAEIENAVMEEVLNGVSSGIAEEVKARVEAEVLEAMQKEIKARVKAELQAEIKARVVEEVSAGVTKAIEDNLMAEIRDGVMKKLEEETYSAILKEVSEQYGAEVLAEVEKQVKQAIEDQTLIAVKEAVNAEIEARVQEEVHSALVSEVENSEELQTYVKDEVEKRVIAEFEAQADEYAQENLNAALTLNLLYWTADEERRQEIEEETYNTLYKQRYNTLMLTKNSTVKKYYNEAFPQVVEQVVAEREPAIYEAELQKAMDAYFDTNVADAYPAALQKAMDENYLKNVDEQYLIAMKEAGVDIEGYAKEIYDEKLPQVIEEKYETLVQETYDSMIDEVMAANYETEYKKAYRPALEKAYDLYYYDYVAPLYNAALQEAMDTVYEDTVNEQYNIALQKAISENADSLVRETYETELQKALDENYEAKVNEVLPNELQKAIDENFEQAVNEAYPEALQKVIDSDVDRIVNEQVEIQLEQIIQETLDSLYEEEMNDPEHAELIKWYILDRTSCRSYLEYKNAVGQMRNIAKLFPVFFFFIAMLVCFTTMTRMVNEQREAIGTYKALGYSTRLISLKYILYALIASLLGSILGAVIGMLIFPRVIYFAWEIAYKMDKMESADTALIYVLSAASMTVAMVLAALLASIKELVAGPATLMRPKSPKAGKRIFLERFHLLWRRFSFSWKVTTRNIFRYKKRFIMTLIGVAGCTALLITGFGISDSVHNLLDKQYGQIEKADLYITLKGSLTEEEYLKVEKELSGFSAFNDTYPMSRTVGLINSVEEADSIHEDLSVNIFVAENLYFLSDYLAFTTPLGKTMKPQAGLVYLSNSTIDKLGLKEGDIAYLENRFGDRVPFVIDCGFEYLVGNVIVMNSATYETLFGYPETNNTVLAKADIKKENENTVSQELMDVSGVSTVTFISSSISEISKGIESLSLITVVLIISSGLLSFVVLYNMANVTISERKREIATIKVLGFHDHEVNSYIYRESLTITGLGAFIGLFIGIVLHRTIMNSITMEGINFGHYVNPLSFIYSFALTVIFSFIVNYFVNRKLKEIPMVESLKSVE